MRSWLKAFVVVAVTLPIAAYVVATLGASPADPTPRSPVILRDASPGPTQDAPEQNRRGERSDPARDKDQEPRDDDTDDRGNHDVSVVTPSPKRLGDDDGTDDDGGEGHDDDDTTAGGDT